MKDLLEDTSGTVKPADKRGAIMIKNTSEYIKEAMRQLKNRQHYEPSNVKLFDQSNNKVKTNLSNCVNNSPSRPIISACGSPTEKISAFVDHTLLVLALHHQLCRKCACTWRPRLPHLPPPFIPIPRQLGGAL